MKIKNKQIGCLLVIILFLVVTILFVLLIRSIIADLRPAHTDVEEVEEVITTTFRPAAAPAATGGETIHRVEIYESGDGPAPAWYDPDEPMAAEWVDDSNAQKSDVNPTRALQSTPCVRDIASPDWNLNTSLIGWDGRMMEIWEMDLFSRIAYLEFWGASSTCCEAGVDAILRMWESEYYGRTIFETLSAVTESGSWAYSTYPAVWTTTYNADGLAEMRTLCEERFYSGPVWIAPYFQKYSYPVWPHNSPIPCYEIDGVFFSMPRGQ